jgi:hypothetical protein
MASGDFYLTAPSNASRETYPDNTQSTFKIRTATPIDLGRYTVALTEIHYPKSWMNVTDASFTIKFPNNDAQTVKLLEGRYDDMEQLMEALQKQLVNLRVSSSIIVHYDKIRRKVLISIRQEGAVLTISEQLRRIFGFKNARFDKGVHTSEYHTDIDEGMAAIYVYGSFVQNQLVGDSLVPLLRVVPIRGPRNELYRSEEFLHPHHLPTINETTAELRFYLRRDDGTPISFKTGKVVLTLHFRRRI